MLQKAASLSSSWAMFGVVGYAIYSWLIFDCGCSLHGASRLHCLSPVFCLNEQVCICFTSNIKAGAWIFFSFANAVSTLLKWFCINRCQKETP